MTEKLLNRIEIVQTMLKITKSDINVTKSAGIIIKFDKLSKLS